jgi:hypothetical protein
VKVVYPGFIASLISRALPMQAEAAVDQHQANGMWGVHQLRVRLQGDPTTYRVLICPDNAPIHVGRDSTTPIDKHFLERIDA